MSAELPIACSLTGTDQQARAAEWRRLLSGATRTRNGLVVTVRFAATRARPVAELVAAEKRCCPFLGFQLEVDGAETVLTVTAPSADAMQFVDDLVG